MNFGVRNMDKNWNIRLDQVCLVCGSQNFSPLTQKKHMVMWLMVLSLWKSQKYNDFFPRCLKIFFIPIKISFKIFSNESNQNDASLTQKENCDFLSEWKDFEFSLSIRAAQSHENFPTKIHYELLRLQY